MKFGPAEMAQMMDSAKALITVAIVAGVGIGIVLGAIVAFYRIFFRHRAADHFYHREADQSSQSGMPTVPALPGVPAWEIDATAPHSLRSPVPRGNNKLRLVYLLGIIVILIAIAESKRSDFAATYNNQLGVQPSPPAIEPQQQVREATSNQLGVQPSPPAIEPPPPQQVRSDFEETYKQLGIQPLPLTVERRPQVQSRLAQLSREVCYTDAIVGLGRALLDAGYPREAAISSRSFVKRCGSVSAQEVLPQAYTALQKLNDWSGALDVADELVNALPASATARYWRAMAYDNTGKFSQAMLDYMNTVQLIGDPKAVFGDVFYKWSRTYASLARYCDAISPIEMYISLDPANRRTPQTTKIISDYAEKGDCDKRYATGTTRVPFALRSGVRTLSVVVNNVPGTMILDTGATFVSITSRFAAKAGVTTQSGNQVIMKTVGGKVFAEIGYANSMSAGKAAAFGVTTAVMRDDGDPFGKGVDGLLGMSFLSRFNVRLSQTEVEMTATPLRSR
jgi:aspartyl protease family protein